MQLPASQLSSHLKNGLKPLYTVHGDEPLLVIEAADAILAGKVQPTIWAATDDLSLRYLEDRWSQRGDALPREVVADAPARTTRHHADAGVAFTGGALQQFNLQL